MHEGHRKRLRQRFIDSLSSGGDSGAFSEAELAELLLTYAIPRRDVAPAARELIACYGSLKKAAEAPYGEAESISGVSESTSVLLKLIDRAADGGEEPRSSALPAERCGPAPLRLRSIKEAAAYCRGLLSGCAEECMLQVLLGEDSAVLGAFFIASGTAAGVELPAELIAANARMVSALGVVVAHNHPSGDIRPSAADVDATRRLALLLQKNGCRLYEHIIVSERGCYAMLNAEPIEA